MLYRYTACNAHVPKLEEAFKTTSGALFASVYNKRNDENEQILKFYANN